MKKIITTALAAIMLLGLSIANAQVQKNTLSDKDNFFIPPHFASPSNPKGNNSVASLNKKTMKQRLDSVLEEKYNPSTNNYSPFIRNQHTYDYNGHLLSKISIMWNSSDNNWRNNTKQTNTYNSLGLLGKEENYTWDTTNNAWAGSYKNELTYDSKGNQTSYTSYSSWDATTHAFIPSGKTIYLLNAAGKTITSLDSSWDSNNHIFVIGTKVEYTYDVNGNNTSSSSYTTNGFNWAPTSKTENTFNTSGKVLTTLITYNNNGNWQNGSKNEYTYNSNGDQTSEMNYNWNAQGNKWDNYNKNISLYDANFNPTSYTSSTWNNTKLIWDYTYKNEYIFDTYGDMINYAFYAWNPGLNQWRNNNQYKYTFNTAYASNDIVWDMGGGVYFKHMITGFLMQYGVGSTWVNSSRFTPYYSSNDFNGIAELNINTTILYPNPTSGLLTITSLRPITTIDVYRITGELVSSTQNITNQENIQLDFSSLSNGIYFVHTYTINGEERNHKVFLSK